MNLLHLFDLSLVARAWREPLEWQGRVYTFGEIEARSNRMANALRARGFVKGDRLCVYLANRIELIDLFLACVKLGVIFVPINVLYLPPHVLEDFRKRFGHTILERYGMTETFMNASNPCGSRASRAPGRA